MDVVSCKWLLLWMLSLSFHFCLTAGFCQKLQNLLSQNWMERWTMELGTDIFVLFDVDSKRNPDLVGLDVVP